MDPLQLLLLLLACLMSYIIGHRMGEAWLARYVWNLMANHRQNEDVKAVLMLCAAKSPTVMMANGWSSFGEAERTIKNGVVLEDDL